MTNLDIIRERWPRLHADLVAAVPLLLEPDDHTFTVNSLHLSSSTNPTAEAQQQAAKIPADADHAWLYGFPIGHVARVLLQRPKLKLVVVPMNLGLTRAILERVDCTDWLANPMVIMERASEIQRCYGPFVCCPGDCKLSDDKALPLRDRIKMVLNTPFQDLALNAQKDKDLASMEANKAIYENEPDVTSIFGKYPDVPAIVIGGGPTLGGQFEFIRKHADEWIVVAVSTALKPLLGKGIVPDLVVVMDPSRLMLAHFDGLERDRLTETMLIYDPVIQPDILRRWPGPRAAFTTRRESVLFCAGSVIHPATDIALKIGAPEIHLIGADFAFVGDKSHVTGAALAHGLEAFEHIETLDGFGNRVRTSHSLCQYRIQLEDYIAAHPEVKWFKRGQAGCPVRGAAWSD